MPGRGPARHLAAALGALLVIGGCVRPPAALSPADCRPPEGVLPAGTSVAQLVGSFDLILVASRGPAARSAVGGTLQLASRDGTVSGSAAVALDSVGAESYGDPRSTDSSAPGVLALVQADGGILLRLGSHANRKDIQAFEGPYMVMHVRQLTPSGFDGTWASGATRTTAEGHYCAVRSR